MQTTIETPHAPNSLKGRLRAAERRYGEALARGDRMKQKNAEQRGEIKRLERRIEQLERPVKANLPALIRAHHAAVVDGVGSWGDTEAALFAALGLRMPELGGVES